MKYSKNQITIDLKKTEAQPVTIDAQLGDTGRQIIISFFDGGKPYTLTDDCHGVLAAKKPDGTTLFEDCIIQENNLIYTFSEQTCACTDIFPAEIRLYGSNGALLTTTCFYINVTDTVFHPGDDIDSKSTIDAVNNLYAKSHALYTQVKEEHSSGKLKGPKGDRGDPGPQGIQGIQGTQGPQGPAGKDSVQIDDSIIRADAPWSSQKIMDFVVNLTCPVFETTGPVVNCTPVPDYPLHVTSKIELSQEGSGAPHPDHPSPFKHWDRVELFQETSTEKLIYTAQLGKPVCEGLVDWKTKCLTTSWSFLEHNVRWNTYLDFDTADVKHYVAFTTGNSSKKHGEINIKSNKFITKPRAFCAKEPWIISGEPVYDGYLYISIPAPGPEPAQLGAWLREKGIEIIYELETPITQNIQIEQVPHGKRGLNTLYSNASQITVSGYTPPAK